MRLGLRWRHAVAAVGLALWGALFARAYANLSIPAFGPAEQAGLAMRSLTLRYVVVLGLGILVYAVAAKWTERRVAARAKGRSLSNSM